MRLALVLIVALAAGAAELRFAMQAEPKSFDPLLSGDEPSQTVLYLTGGVLIRVNRLTQALEPELATSWKVLPGGRKISFRLREGVLFSDGTPFSADDVARTFKRLMDPALHSPVGDAFRAGGGGVEVEVTGPHRLTLTFPAPIGGMEGLFDGVAIGKERAVLGPFLLREHKAGSHLLLERNPHYWRRDAQGRRLPYLDSVRLDIQQNRDFELLRFRRGELHLINNVSPELFEQLAGQSPTMVSDNGPSLDAEFLWFNQVAAAPIPGHKKDWFRSRSFRRAISEAIQREDIARVVYRGHARPAAGPVSPANRFWFNSALAPHRFDTQAALKRLEQDGFRLAQNVLRDRAGNAVEFSLITNAGNKTRERMAVLIEQDLAKLGIRVSVVALDFPSLITRINRSFDYDACLLGLANVDLDPNGQMNVWLSSASHHAWNPNQPKPATVWETEIDMLMRTQASLTEPKRRKALFDRVQQIVWDEAPLIYLVHRNSLAAISPALRDAAPAVLFPQTFWNIDRLSLK